MSVNTNLEVRRLELLKEVGSGVAHEVNNPLQAILNYCYLLTESSSDPTCLESIREIQSAAEALSTELGALFDLLRAPMRARDITARELATRVELLTRYPLSKRQQRLEVTLDAPDVVVWGDRASLVLCAVELVLAAGEHAPVDSRPVQELGRTRAAIALELQHTKTSQGGAIELRVALGAAPDGACPFAAQLAESLAGELLRRETESGRQLVLRLPAS